ncbi:MAG: AraC family transcriptional regulator [Chitinophagaceae bacterium]
MDELVSLIQMPKSIVILNEALRREVMVEDLQLLHQQDKLIPNSVQYDIRRYKKAEGWTADDMGMIAYNYVAKNSGDNCLELKFCVSGNAYCEEDDCSGDYCKKTGVAACNEKTETIDVFGFRFTPSYLEQFLNSKFPDTRAEKILSFEHDTSVTHTLPLCSKNKVVLESLFNHRYTDSLGNIYLNAQIQTLLLYSLDCLFGEKEEIFACKFLANEGDRDKIIKAREILLQRIGDPITIKELSRKVATNECYLKKGFKEMFGTTIFDFYQGQRMEHAKYLLYDKGLSVTDVSALLGYSSISHFSTAFKKHTGLKPCELLMR